MDKSGILDEVKLFKGITDSLQDDLISLIIDDSIDRILAEVNSMLDNPISELPNSLTFIVRDVAIKRYNKLNSEGTKEDSEEGRSFKWENSYLDEYRNILANLGRSYRARGIARFM
ncbi:hypothetical protein Javan249_0035 [Streptococcus phage Javan249]|uniref:phage head-tail connector protein n=1 Tax=Streptococcus halotolerans TaxID=1814128 RepID=UPI000787F7C5|nr:phage head-tail connector protein [Streptococcus halotolerans]QBX16401.1 hypothetical protein Javan249_0035 [Streptococcus phage Javan249]